MKRRLLLVPLMLIAVVYLSNCAKKGTPSGGPRDTIPPVIIRSAPDNYTILFDQDEIRVYFDEYIKLKDLQKNLIISPPLTYDPLITPINTSKQLRIRILDTLETNTTYSFNFGQSIVDNNEENAYDYYKYVFSTGDYIDSLKVTGEVKDGLLPVAEFPVTLMLYEVNENFKDSLIYSEKPSYITTTRDSSNTFELTNVKEGRYLLLALKEENPDFTFQPATDKVGFAKEYIELPTDSTFRLTIFNEELPYEPGRAAHVGKFRFAVGYRGDASGVELEPLSQVPQEFESITIRDAEKDSLQYWFRPEITTDTLLLLARHKERLDTLVVRMRNLYADSLQIKGERVGTLLPTDTVKLKVNTPVERLDQSMVRVMDKDSLMLPASMELDPEYNMISVVFPLDEAQQYEVSLLPGAVTDFYEQQNDSLDFKVRTKTADDYGTISLVLENLPSTAVIVQLLDEKFLVSKEQILLDEQELNFTYIDPGNYYIRLILDENGNGVWDSGDFLTRRDPEKVLYYPTMLEIRANWTLDERFRLD